jgi:hypothetical protein
MMVSVIKLTAVLHKGPVFDFALIFFIIVVL